MEADPEVAGTDPSIRVEIWEVDAIKHSWSILLRLGSPQSPLNVGRRQKSSGCGSMKAFHLHGISLVSPTGKIEMLRCELKTSFWVQLSGVIGAHVGLTVC